VQRRNADSGKSPARESYGYPPRASRPSHRLLLKKPEQEAAAQHLTNRTGITMTNADLARRVVQLARQHPPQTPDRRAAGMAYAALITTKTPDSARRALDTFGDPFTRAAAVVLLDQLQRDESHREAS
jgi:hypothetical protein